MNVDRPLRDWHNWRSAAKPGLDLAALLPPEMPPMSARTEAAGLVPNFGRRPGERYDIRPHGTEARARRERRHGLKPCALCLPAENRAHAYQAALRRRSR